MAEGKGRKEGKNRNSGEFLCFQILPDLATIYKLIMLKLKICFRLCYCNESGKKKPATKRDCNCLQKSNTDTGK